MLVELECRNSVQLSLTSHPQDGLPHCPLQWKKRQAVEQKRKEEKLGTPGLELKLQAGTLISPPLASNPGQALHREAERPPSLASLLKLWAAPGDSAFDRKRRGTLHTCHLTSLPFHACMRLKRLPGCAFLPSLPVCPLTLHCTCLRLPLFPVPLPMYAMCRRRKHPSLVFFFEKQPCLSYPM